MASKRTAWAQERICNHFSANRESPYVAPRYDRPASAPIQRKPADGGDAAAVAKSPAIGASLPSGQISLAVDPKSRDYLSWLRKVKLGNPASETNQQLFEQRATSVESYVGRFKKGGVNSKLPATAKVMSVEQALIAGEVDGVNVRKLLTDLREKFNK